MAQISDCCPRQQLNQVGCQAGSWILISAGRAGLCPGQRGDLFPPWGEGQRAFRSCALLPPDGRSEDSKKGSWGPPGRFSRAGLSKAGNGDTGQWGHGAAYSALRICCLLQLAVLACSQVTISSKVLKSGWLCREKGWWCSLARVS